MSDSTTPATAEDMDALRRGLTALRADVADLSSALDGAEEEIAATLGQLETIAATLGKLAARLDR